MPTYQNTISNNNVWVVWNDSTAPTSAITSSTYTTGGPTSAIIWTVWNSSASTTTLSYSSNVWTDWNVRYAPSVIRSVLAQESPEVVQARLQEREANRQRQIQAEGERALARERAALLLQEHLSEQQQLELKDKGYFSLSVIDGETGEERLYRIKRGRSQNVQQVDREGRRIKTLCAHPIIACPDEDTMLAQKLMLETQEREFLRIANHS